MRSSSGANAVISLVFVSTSVWPSTTPLAWSRAPSRCTARPSAWRAPRADLPSRAIARTGPPLVDALLVDALLVDALLVDALLVDALLVDALLVDALLV